MTGTGAPAREDDGASRIPLAAWRDLATPAAAIALAWSLLQIAAAFQPAMDVQLVRAGHVAFALALAFVLTSRGGSASWRRISYGLAVLAALPPLWLWLEIDRINDRWSGLDPLETGDIVCAVLLLVLLFEASRRVLGLGMTLLGLGLVAYQFAGDRLPGLLAHRETGVLAFLDRQLLTLDGVFGVPVGVSAEVVFYFVLFAAAYETFGGGRMIIDLALALTGHRTGGPAKAAVLSSGLMGSVSGSAVANVMSTGIFTIPLMKRVGYSPVFAGAVEATASTGGQIMPPVMGAAAFVMADYLQVPYAEIVLAAIVPAILYFVAILAAVHLQARRWALARIAPDEMPSIRRTLVERGHMVIPLAWLAWRIVAGYGITDASVEAIGLTVVVGLVRPATRQGPLALVRALVSAAERAVSVALPCALAGVIVSVIAYTGIGTKFNSMVVHVAGGSMPLILGLAMLSSLVLGAGMPTTSAYIMGAVLIAPALIQLGVAPLIAHFFVLYFSIMSMLTPPVALSAYAAATISGAPANATGWRAFMLAIPGFTIPYALFLHPGMVLMGDWTDTVWGVAAGLAAFLGLSAGLIGWLGRVLAPWERVAMIALAALALWPDPWWVGVAAAAAMAALALRARRKGGPVAGP